MQMLKITRRFLNTALLFTASCTTGVFAQILDYDYNAQPSAQSDASTGLATWVKRAAGCNQVKLTAPKTIYPKTGLPIQGAVHIQFNAELSGNCAARKQTYSFVGYRYDSTTVTPEVDSWLTPVQVSINKTPDYAGVCQRLKPFTDTKIGLNRARDFCAAVLGVAQQDAATQLAIADILTLGDEVRTPAEAALATDLLERAIKHPRPTLSDNDTPAAYAQKLATMYAQDQARRRLSQLYIIGIAGAKANEKQREDKAFLYSRTDPSFLEWYGRFLLLRAQATKVDPNQMRQLIEDSMGSRAGPAARMVAQLHDKGQASFAKDLTNALGWYKYAALTGSDAAWRIMPTLPKSTLEQTKEASKLCLELFSRFFTTQITIRKSETGQPLLIPISQATAQCELAQ